jgi:hypothetical protein
MKKKDREAALERVREIARHVRSIVTYDGHYPNVRLGRPAHVTYRPNSSPPDWRPAVAELADELALVIEALS